MENDILDRPRQRLSVSDVRALLRLSNELHASGQEWEDRKLRLLDGLRSLTQADRASASVATFTDEAALAPTILSVAHVPGDRLVSTRGELEVEPQAAHPELHAAWQAYRRLRNRQRRLLRSSPAALISHRARGAAQGHFVHSFVPLSEGRAVACLTIARERTRPRFGERERGILCALHAEVRWIYRADAMLVSPETRSLTRRQRETLHHLLAGKPEKQIAQEMSLSHNTVHHYVKALHKHFRVGTRRELLARWVGR